MNNNISKDSLWNIDHRPWTIDHGPWTMEAV